MTLSDGVLAALLGALISQLGTAFIKYQDRLTERDKRQHEKDLAAAAAQQALEKERLLMDSQRSLSIETHRKELIAASHADYVLLVSKLTRLQALQGSLAEDRHQQVMEAKADAMAAFARLYAADDDAFGNLRSIMEAFVVDKMPPEQVLREILFYNTDLPKR